MSANDDLKLPSHVRDKIEEIKCRGCGAERATCVRPRGQPVLASVAFHGQDHRSEFCYERVFDYFESFRPHSMETGR